MTTEPSPTISRPRFTWLDLPLTLFFLSAALALLPAHDKNQSLIPLLFLEAGFLLYLLISRFARSQPVWRAVAFTLVGACAIFAVYFITQYAYFRYEEKVSIISLWGYQLSRFFPSFAVWAPVQNSVGTLLEGSLFIGIGLALTEKRRAWWILATIFTALIAMALELSASRGAWLAVLIAGLIWLALHFRLMRWLALASSVLAVVILIYVLVRKDVNALNDIPVLNVILDQLFLRPDRLDVYRNSIYLIQDFPFSGIGLGLQFPMIYSKYALIHHVVWLTYSHNLFIEVWLQQGLLGVVGGLWLLTSLYQSVFRLEKQAHDLLYQSSWIGLTAVVIHGFTDARQYIDPWTWLPFFILLGLNAAFQLRKPIQNNGKRLWLVPLGVTIIFLAVVAINLRSIPAAWQANLGALAQTRAELQPGLNSTQRNDLMQQASQYYQKAATIDPLNRTAQLRLGMTSLNQDRFEEAIQHLELAQKSDPDNTTVQKALGYAYLWTGQVEKAEPLLRNAFNIMAELNYWGWYHGSKNEIDRAINAYRLSLQINPDQEDIKFRLDNLLKTK